VVSPPRFKPRSIGCQTCTLTAMSKSPAEWHGSQSTHSCVVMAHLYTALTFGKRTLALHAHRPSTRIHQPYFSHPECPTHKCFTHLWGPSHRGQPTCTSMCSDCHAIEPDSLALRSGCMFGTL